MEYPACQALVWTDLLAYCSACLLTPPSLLIDSHANLDADFSLGFESNAGGWTESAFLRGDLSRNVTIGLI